ncbi:hypothetical protein Ctob_003111, partial [Chrysochromulina tobinii]
KGKELSIVWDETIVGRRIRAFFPGSGEYAPPARAARKEGAKFTASYDDGETEELSLPDESVRLLPEGCGQGAEAPPLTREDEKRAYKCQAQLAEDAARAEIEAEGIELLTSSKTSTGYRCVSGTLVQGLGVMSYEVVPNKDGKKVVPNKDGKKIHLGKFKSKLEAALVFYKYMQGLGTSAISRVGGLEAGGKANTIEKVLDVRDVEIEVDAETGDPISDEIVRYVPPSAEGTESVGAQDSAELMQVTTHLSTPPLFNVPPLDESMLAALPSCEQWGGWPRLQLSKSAVHHTKTTLAVLAAKLPHEFGVLMRTRAAVAEAVQLIESVEDAASYHAQIAPPRVEAPVANGQRWFPYPPDTFEMALDTALVMALDTAPAVGPG